MGSFLTELFAKLLKDRGVAVGFLGLALYLALVAGNWQLAAAALLYALKQFGLGVPAPLEPPKP